MNISCGIEGKKKWVRSTISFVTLTCIALFLLFHLVVLQTIGAQRSRNKKWSADNAERFFIHDRISDIYFAINDVLRRGLCVQIPLAVHTNFKYRSSESILFANPNVDIWKKTICVINGGEDFSVTNEWLYLVMSGGNDGKMRFFMVHPLYEFEQIDFMRFFQCFRNMARQTGGDASNALTPNSDSIDIEEIINELESQGLLMGKGGTR